MSVLWKSFFKNHKIHKTVCRGSKWTVAIILSKRKVLRKHSLHGENSSLGFIEAVHKWKWNMPHHWRHLANVRNSFFKGKQYTIHNPRGQEKHNYTMKVWNPFVYRLLCRTLIQVTLCVVFLCFSRHCKLSVTYGARFQMTTFARKVLYMKLQQPFSVYIKCMSVKINVHLMTSKWCRNWCCNSFADLTTLL